MMSLSNKYVQEYIEGLMKAHHALANAEDIEDVRSKLEVFISMLQVVAKSGGVNEDQVTNGLRELAQALREIASNAGDDADLINRVAQYIEPSDGEDIFKALSRAGYYLDYLLGTADPRNRNALRRVVKDFAGKIMLSLTTRPRVFTGFAESRLAR